MSNYLDLLGDELNRRIERNKNYSKRAFARDLGLSPGFLIQLLSGKKKLSPDRASTIVKGMDWPSGRKKLFLNLVRLSHAKSEDYKLSIKLDMQKKGRQSLVYRELKHDTLKVISNWYYHALLTLTEIKDFKYDEKWIADRLSLPIEKVRSAIMVLKNLNLVREEAGTLVSQFQMLRVSSIPSRAIREHHRQYLEKAKMALETQDPSERDITGSTLAINIKRLPEAKKLIKEFRETLAELLSEPGKNTHVYRLSVELFRVDQASDRKVGKKGEK